LIVGEAPPLPLDSSAMGGGGQGSSESGSGLTPAQMAAAFGFNSVGELVAFLVTLDYEEMVELLGFFWSPV